MVTKFKKNPRKGSIIIAILLVIIGIVSFYTYMQNAQGDKESQIASPLREYVEIPLQKVAVQIDMEKVKADQESVDQGHSPWQLDPVQTAMTFVSLQISPEGITGEFPIKLEDIKVIKQTNAMAVVDISGDKTPISRVHLEKLIRQDETGIWTVVGYDPKEGQVSAKLSPFNGDAAVVKVDKVLEISEEKWQAAKDEFVKQHYSGEEIQKLKQTDFKSERLWKGTLNNKQFELELYYNMPFQVFITRHGEQENIQLLQDFYFQPYIFHGDGVRMQLFTKGVGITYDIATGKYGDKSQGEIDALDKIALELSNQRNGGGIPVGSEIEIAENKIKFLDENTLIIK